MKLKNQIKSMKEKDPSIKSSIEVILYPGFWILICHSLAHKLYKKKLFFVSRLISQLGRFFTGIEIHPGAIIGEGLFIDHGMGVVIGETCRIGDNVIIYQGVTLGGTGKEKGKRHPTIGNNVLIGSGVKVLGPIKIGDNSRIGAGSVVLQNIEPNSTVVGVPGRAIKRKEQLNKSTETLDHGKYPDPISMELCKVQYKIEKLEKKIKNLEEGIKQDEAIQHTDKN